MVNTSDMIIGSISKIWHLIPIVIAIVLFKKFINNKDKKRRVKENKENDEKGLTLESLTGEKYEKLGYEVIFSKIGDGKKEQGIDLLCYRNNETIIFQCKNYSNSKSITDEDIKMFIRNASNYVKANNIDENSVKFRYAIHYLDALDKSAIKLFRDGSYNCEYVVL